MSYNVVVANYHIIESSPWRNTRNRQDISEDAYLEVARLNSSTGDTNYFTLHCSAQT